MAPRPLPSLRRRRALALALVLTAAGGGVAAAQEAADPLGLRAGLPPPPATAEAAPPEDLTPLGAAKPSLARLRKPGAKPPPRPGELPRLAPYRNAERLGQRGGPPSLAETQVPPPHVAALPAPAPRPRLRPEEEHPFDPVGVRVGDLKLTPYVEEDIGAADNPARLPGKQKASGFETTEAGFGLASDWSRHALSGELRGGYTDYFADRSANAPFADGALRGRYDVSRDLDFDAEGRLHVGTVSLSSLGAGAGVGFAGARAPLTETLGATLGATQKFGRLALSLHGSLDRTASEDATLSNGIVDRLSSDNFDDWGLRARAAYEISPAFAPFVEAETDARRYDATRDANGYARNSDGVAARAGARIELTRQLTGEASLGYGERDYADTRLPQLAGLLIDASLVWSATPLTTVTLKAKSGLVDSTIPGASGAANRAFSVEVAHALRRYLTLTANAGYASDDYFGAPLRDSTLSFALGAAYSLNRDVVLKASLTRQYYQANTVGANYAATAVMIGLRLQR